MISRIYVAPKKDILKINSYLIDAKLSRKELEKLAQTLTNPTLEEYFIDRSPDLSDFSYAIEIGFLPGVTDNVATTTKEIATDLWRLKKDSSFAIYSSKIFLIKKAKNIDEVRGQAVALFNPLIERVYVAKIKNGKMDLPKQVPKVVLKKTTAVANVQILRASDEELQEIGEAGIMDENGKRRGPLALDISYMHAIKNYFTKLKRNPTDIELESLAQTWSEHCKHTIFANPIDNIEKGLYKTYIKGATNEIRKRKGEKDFCVSVFSDNAGGIIFDKDYLITHKVETHNSPSALDPFGGAVTGIVGVNRDTIGFGLGAKPVANAYGFCFGEPEDNRKLFRNKKLTQPMLSTRRIIDGVVQGINVGGNCSGIPTLSGFTKYDHRFRGKPLVFAGTVGLIPRKIGKRLSHDKKARNGDYIVMIGGRVGLDGIHGATFSSVTIDSKSPATAVQIGDPITQKKLSDAIVKEARGLGLYNSITDNGAGGLSSSVAEMAKESGGLKVDLEKVPTKYPGLRPWEIWISESQERMTLAVPKTKWKKLKKLMDIRGVEATVIGEFTNSGKANVFWKGKKIMDLDMEFLHDGLPKHHLHTAPYSYLNPEPKFPKIKNYSKVLENLLKVNNISGFSFISDQYDYEVQASSVLKPISGAGRINTDAQIFSPVLDSKRGVVLSTGIFPSYSDINTYDMAACALDTAVRNAIASGGTLLHLALLDNFCWSSSNDEKRLAQLKDSVKACYDYATAYGTPFISGKDSMFNDFKGYDEKGNPIKISVPPTLLISAIGVVKDIHKTVSPEFKNGGDAIYLLGETNNELGASEYFKYLAKRKKNNALGNSIPKVDAGKNLKTYQALEKAIKTELISSAISVNSGGLAVALSKACVGGNLGCDINIKKLPGNASSIDAKLFGESQGRILVSVSSKNIVKFEKIMKNIPLIKIGKTQKSGKVIIRASGNKIVDTSVKKLHNAYHSFSKKMR